MSCRPSSMLNVKSLSKLMSGYMQQEFHLKHYIHYQSVNIVNYGLVPLHEFQLTCCLVISQNYFCVVFTLTLQDLVTLLCGLRICFIYFRFGWGVKIGTPLRWIYKKMSMERKCRSIKVKTLLMALEYFGRRLFCRLVFSENKTMHAECKDL